MLRLLVPKLELGNQQKHFGDHPPPHFHAVYGEYNALFNIETLEMKEGDLPERARRLVIEWAAMYQKELTEMWDKQEFHKLPPLK
jgi:hypothetical protein